MNELQATIQAVMTAKATSQYWRDVEIYGSERQALRALDCIDRAEAIKMLAVVQPVSVFKREGKVVVQ